jgi:hypothetical protein
MAGRATFKILLFKLKTRREAHRNINAVQGLLLAFFP